MPGVKKIGIDYSKKNPIVLIHPNKKWIYIKPDEWVHLKVIEWLPGTTEEQKKKPLTWIRQTPDRKTILKQVYGSTYSLEISKKGSGPQGYYVEASLGGKPDFKNDVGLYIGALSDKRITKTQWRLTKSGKSIKNKNNTNYISYGDEVYLYAFTEGMNGINNIVVEIYNQQLGTDRVIKTYKKVACVGGEIFLQIRDTSSWRTSVRNIQNIEQFYVKIKYDNQYIIDKYGDDEHAIYLNVKNELSSNNPKPPVNNTPTKVYKPDVNTERYEPCKFETIKITETTYEDGQLEQEEVLVFDNGKNLVDVKSVTDHIRRTIFFKFDSAIIDKDGEKVLNNILRFLLDHSHSTIQLDGFACVIGKMEYNQTLSKTRSDVVKKFFYDGGLSKTRIISTGHGEVEPSDNKSGRDNIIYKDESKNINARRVDIKFIFYGHDANTIVYDTIAPSDGKEINLDIIEFKTNDCFRGTDKHQNKIQIIDAGQALDDGDQAIFASPPSIRQTVRSNISNFNIAPIKYIWPVFNNPNLVYFHINSCRYFSKKNEATLLIRVYPDIKWELALQFQMDISNYKATNMPSGSIYAKHQEKSMEAGYARWLMNKQGKVPIKIGLSLSAKWDEERKERSLTGDIKTKMESLAKIISRSADIVQNAVNYAQGLAKTTALPVGFDIRYPNFTVVASWNLERINKRNQINTIGELGFAFDPLIGAEAEIDLLAAVITGASGGNPAIGKIVSKFRGNLEQLGGSLTFTATFSGELSAEIDALKIDAINGIDMQGKTTIGGDFKVKLVFKMSIEVGKSKYDFVPIDLKLMAHMSIDSGFGADCIFDSDKKGLYVEPILKFAGVRMILEIVAEAGWWEGNFTINEVVIKEEKITLGKKYIT